jgi:selenoprotein W-related protein
LAATLLGALKQKIKSLTLVPAGGGCFELEADGELLYSKLQTRQFPDERELLAAIQARLKGR